MRAPPIRAAVIAPLIAIGVLAGAAAARAQDNENFTRPENWGFAGIFGTYDRAALQRGFQVYSQACAACHAMNFLRYGDLEGIGLTPGQTAAIAATSPRYDAAAIVAGSAPSRPAIATRADVQRRKTGTTWALCGSSR